VSDANDAASGSKRCKSSTSNPVRELATTIVRPPPRHYPIFGIDGIMHGVALKIGARRKDYILDSHYPKREAKVYSHNGLQVGDWWPMQLLALFHGAHGARMGRIAGNAETGAYSVVTAGGPYEDLDQDKGDVLRAAGFGSGSSKSSAATLRPTVGIRYDGLYRMVAMQFKTNMSGGLYEQFKLERLDGQLALSSFVKSRPNAREVRDFDRREDGY
jgi:hypothetical protein